MDVAAKLAEAQIVRVAVIDDDLSTRITSADLQQQEDKGVVGLLNDRADPDREAYLSVLAKNEYKREEVPDLAEPLANPAVRAAAPSRLRQAAEAVLQARADRAAPVSKVIDLLKSMGVDEANIRTFDTPSLPPDETFDLIIVDYFLVDTTTDATLPFIRDVKVAHDGTENPLQIILMSSYDARLRLDFKTIRPELKVSSSRMRILQKPVSDAHLIEWRAALFQLASDRNSVALLERFIRDTGDALRRAADSTATRLWELDLQAMDLLHELASNDHDDYARYVEDVVSRRLLSELEEDGTLLPGLRVLDDAFAGNRTSNLLAPPSEVGDSRAAIHALMQAMEWRRGSMALPPFPSGQPELERATWIRKHIRFGMVLHDPTGVRWLNITQACDLAQAKNEDIDSSTLLFVRGQASLPASDTGNVPEYYVSMSAMMAQGDNHILTWNLRDVRAESIKSFSNSYAQGWQAVAELRPDKAQSISAQFGARMARVGLPMTLAAWRLSGLALRVDELLASTNDAKLPGLALTGQAIRRAGASKHELHLDRASLNALLEKHGDAIDNGVLPLVMGLTLKPGNCGDLNSKPLVVYCAAPANGNVARAAIKNESWLRGARNAERLVVLLWSAA
ncbi:MAG: hypothetical protein AB7E72_03480 [Lysobacterales bacterium]